MRLAAHAIAVMIVFLGAAACGDDDEDDPGNTPEALAATTTPGDSTTIEVGAILPLTGTLASYGETSDAALAEAVSAINSDSETQIELIIEDSASDPATALEKLRALHERGIRVVIGPYSSSEVAAVMDFANENGVIILSPLSTARTLAIADDNVLRFTPDDEAEGAAVASLAWADGVRTIVAVSRDDPGNNGLRTGMKAAFEAMGGTVLDGPTYATNETDFSDEVTAIETAVSSTGSLEQTGVYLAAFSEVTGLFAAASQSATLSGVPWYGSDSVALSRQLVADATASNFAVETGYPNPILGLRAEDEPLWGGLNDALSEDLGRSVDSFAFAAYDALVTAVAALSATAPGADAMQLREAIIAAAAEADGLTGPLTLNDAGDRALAVYDFWAVCAGADEFVWVKAATAADGVAQRVNPPPTC